MTHFDRKAHGYDVQAIVRTAFPSLTHCRYLLLRIEDAEWARCWLRMLRHSRLVLSVNDVGARAGSIAEAVLVAFSHGGLGKLVEVDSRFPFPTAFSAGMASPARAPLLGDRDRSAWTWGDVAPDGATGNFEVDVLVAHYRKDPFDDTQGLLRPATLRKYGLRAIKRVDTCPFYMADGSEPFGFKDGIAQPRIPGLRGDEAPEVRLLRKLMQRVTRGRRKSEEDDNAVAPGEFILGQVNAYGETAYCPDVVGFSEYEGKGGHFGRNGSYLAVRQIAQDVAAFRDFDKQYENAPAPTPVEKMVGRMKGGQPILAYPHPGADKGAFNTFGFRVEDYEGFHCPRGSHIRRGNPRDALGWDRESGVFASRLHRLIRRGRVYMNQAACGAPGAACKPIAQRDPCGKGLFFIALNADLDRQFEFVQQRWIENPKFADLWDETDPALGGAGRGFSMPGCAPIGMRLRSLPQFTSVTGGGYFFMPSLTALEFIAKGRSAPSMKTQNSDPRSKAAAQAWMDQPEIRERPAPPSGEFEIGLSLGGTVSAGAYSAGVLDFLVEALDEWEKAKGQSGVPKHRVRLRVLTGTSGGGACAATLAKALAYRFPPERIRFGEDPPHLDSVNPLYRLWVHQFDVHDLCEVSDDEMTPPLKSLLHEGPATYPFQDRPPNAAGDNVAPTTPRAWVADPLTLMLTLTNLSGVPYSVPYTGQGGRGQTYRRHADYARFDFYYSNSPAVPEWPDAFAVRAHPEAMLPACQLLPLLEKSWDETWAFVRATTAFPVMFPPIELSRPAWHYLYQPLITPPPAAGGTIALEARVLEPAWSDAKQDPLGEFRFVAVDGGVLNNGPIELARRELAGLVGRNARDADTARRAVVHIDPLVGASTPNGAPQASLQATASATLSSLISHARFSTQDFYLAAEPAGRSRFLITAVRTSNGRSLEGTQALASGSLGAFGGFLSAWYRHHDFMLGRRNCQQFLRRHFALAAGNPSFCEHAAAGDRPIIPLIGSAAIEQVLPAWPAGRFDADQPSGEHGEIIRDAVKRRIAHVDRLALRLLGGRLKLVLFLVVPRFIASIFLTRSVVERISKSLKQHRLLR
jgi:putative iron-dependent peroxidase